MKFYKFELPIDDAIMLSKDTIPASSNTSNINIPFLTFTRDASSMPIVFAIIENLQDFGNSFQMLVDDYIDDYIAQKRKQILRYDILKKDNHEIVSTLFSFSEGDEYLIFGHIGDDAFMLSSLLDRENLNKQLKYLFNVAKNISLA